MSSLSIDKSQIFEESFPKPLVSDSWIVQWFDMHNRIWWEILNTDKIPNGLVDVNGVNKLGKNGQPIVTNVDKWATIIDKDNDPLLKYCLETLIPYLNSFDDIDLKIKKISSFINFIWSMLICIDKWWLYTSYVEWSIYWMTMVYYR